MEENKSEYKYKKGCWVSKKINTGNYENTDVGFSFEIRGDNTTELNNAVAAFKTKAMNDLAVIEREIKAKGGQ